MTRTGSFTAPDGFTGRDSAASSSVRSGHSSSRRAISNRPMGQARMVRSRRNAMIRSSVPAALASGSSRSLHTRRTSAASSSRSSRPGAPGASSRASVWRRPAAFRPPIAPGPEPIRVSDKIRPVASSAALRAIRPPIE